MLLFALVSMVSGVAISNARKRERDALVSLTHEQERYRVVADIVERSLNEIYVFDAQTFKFHHVNQGALKNLKYTLGEMAELTPVDIKPEMTQESFRQLVQPLLEGAKDSLTFETIHRRSDGSTYPVEVHLQLLDSGGKKLFLAVMFDTTERKAAEAAREIAMARVRTLEGIIPICMYCKKIRDDSNTWNQL
jgi:PAS domain S-box-containing protein